MLQIHNTLTRSLEEFKPIDEGKVSFYQCGPTVYSRQHIGNLSSALRGDFIRRSLQYLGYEVKYVRNVTDVGHLVSDDDEGEDKMEKGSKKEGLTPEEIAKKYTELYHLDLEKLNVPAPTVETIATEYIEQMAQMVQELIDRGYAYATELAIYFDVDKFPNYTKLSGQKLDKNISGEGHGDISDPDKKNPYDFAVWFFKTGSHKNALQTWKKKFEGINQMVEDGFPGWHIECSAMSKAELGETIDLHMGGREHIPVHHTNEIAQSEAANGVEFTHYWLHHEMLLIDGGKMSKSLGNVYSLDEIVDKGIDPLSYRYFLLQAHYRSKQNFTWEALESADKAYKKLIEKLRELKKSPEFKIVTKIVNSEYKEKFIEALENDFNIPSALSIVYEVLKSEISSDDKLSLILDFDRVLGLSLNEKINEEVSYPQQIQELIDQRNKARAEKNWELSDQLRDKLKNEFGVEVRDQK